MTAAPITIAPPSQAIDPALTALAAQFLAKPPGHQIARPADTKSKVERLIEWRSRNPKLFEALRVEGMKRSVKVRENLQRIHRECKAQWRASALRNPKLQATEQHIAAKAWRLLSPAGQVHECRNLKKWVRENEELFDAEDVMWKEQTGKVNQAWCRAFHGLSRLRPTCSKRLDEWNGWKWAE